MRFLSDILIEAGLIVDGSVQVNTIAAAVTDTDKFLVSDGGVLKYRTGTQVASDIDAMTKSVYDTDGDGIVDDAEKITVVARNSTGSTIYKGTIVYFSGSTGNRPNMLKAQANSEATSSKTFGVVVADVANNSDGEVAALGTLHDLDTRSNATHPFTSDTLIDGDVLWLSPSTAGYVTRTKPLSPNHAVFIGYVARTSPTNGRIVYKVQNGLELDELHNVSASTPSNNDGIFYNSSTGLWEAKSIATAAGGTIGTVTSVAMTVPTGLQIGGSPITTSGTLALTYASGYAIPTTVKQSNWDDAYTWVSNFPTQTGNTGKFLKTDGSSLSWAVVDALPSQTGNSGKYLTTDGTTASWATINLSGYVVNTRTLTINGTAYDLSADRSWSVGTVTSVAATAGTGISISGSPITGSGTLTITNTAPDQTVSLTAGTGISVSGTYPNFTITNTSTSSGGTVTSVAALTLGTTGTDLSSTVANPTTTPVITLNVPTASSTNRGALSSADWSTFNAKQDAITLTTTGSSGSATLVSATLNVPTYTLSGLGGVPTGRTLTINGTAYDLSADRSWTIAAGITGSGTTNYLSKWTGTSALGNSLVFDNGTDVGINTTSPSTLSGYTMLSINNNTNGGILDLMRNGTSQFRFFTGSTINALWGLTNLPISFQTNGSERMRIFGSTGNLSIGYGGSPTDAGFRVDVSGTFRSTLDANINGLTVGKGTGQLASNTAIGYQALNAASTGNGGNVAVGYQALNKVTSGEYNTVNGWQSGLNITTGSYNHLYGYRTGRNLSTAVGNIMIGYGVAEYGAGNTNYNILIGYAVAQGYFSPSLSDNLVIGRNSGNLISGGRNVLLGYNIATFSTGSTYTDVVALGNEAGTYVGSGATKIATLSNGIYIGYQARASADANTNETVIGYNVVGNGSNSVTLGNTSVTKTVLQSGVLVGTTTSAGYALDVNGTARVSNSTFIQLRLESTASSGGILFKPSSGNTYEIQATTGSDFIIYDRTNTAQRLTLNSSGYFGIGISTPVAQLDVNGGIIAYGTVPATRASSLINDYYSGVSRISAIGANGSTHGIITFNTAPSGTPTLTERMRITGDGSVAIGTSSPNASALLDISSTTKGFLPPRMTNAQMTAITTPASGLMVYDTTNNKLNVYDGTNWVAVH